MLLMERDGSITRPPALERADPVVPAEPPKRPGAVHRWSTHAVAQDEVTWLVTTPRDAPVLRRPVRQRRMWMRVGSTRLPRAHGREPASARA